ncbi:hypothetical protein D9O50_02675 [Oxalobacteraceae bacterium CAVE-383]|nr:hypothetical protein D9O50_02675 [Oxalobacteraceae bacterium CAVE-383]
MALDANGPVHALQLIEINRADSYEQTSISVKPNQHPAHPGKTPQEQGTILRSFNDAQAHTASLDFDDAKTRPESHSPATDRRLSLDSVAIAEAIREIAHEPQHRLPSGIDKKLSAAEKFSNAIDHAKRGDCRSAHANLGILAIPLLLRDAMTDDGCKW